MRSVGGSTIAGVLVLLVLATGVVAAGNVRPEAEAGLDQDAIVNSTVYLDAGGSWDPDGEIVRYEWRIERPNGTIAYPDCRTCSLTHFVPMQAGQYNVTVTVTDDDGGVRSDTLYVVVSGTLPASVPSPGSGRSVAGSGPSVGNVGGGGGGGGYGGGSQPSSIVRNDAGQYLLKAPGGASTGRFTMMVGGERVTIPASVMSRLGADGKVTYSEASRYFNAAGADRDDVRHELQNSRRSCGGDVCTTQVTETDGEVDNGYLSEEQANEAVEDYLSGNTCIKGSCSGGGSGDSSSRSGGTDPGDVNLGSIELGGGGGTSGVDLGNLDIGPIDISGI